jgi:uncharacterized membrane protein YhaH (DUF805 family)
MEKNTKFDAENMGAGTDQVAEERHYSRGRTNWIVGVVFVLAGAAILLGNFTGFRLNNWWALFILIPAVGAFSNAFRSYKNAGDRLNASARGSLIGGLTMVFMMIVFLFSLDLSLLWPVGLVVVGIGMLFSSLVK